MTEQRLDTFALEYLKWLIVEMESGRCVMRRFEVEVAFEPRSDTLHVEVLREHRLAASLEDDGA